MSHAPGFVAEPLEGRQLFSVILVDDDKKQFTNAAYTSLAAAVKAAKAKDTIRLAPGTYRQAITIPAGKDGLTIIADKTRQSTIDPPDGALAAFNVDAKNVTIKKLVINGLKNSYGVLIDSGGSATVSECRIKSVRNNPFDGVQTGFGVAVLKGSAMVALNTIDDYQKGGVYVDGGYSKATIMNNTIIGRGETAVIAQNGIVFNRNATGSVAGNFVSRNDYTGSDATACGISLYKAKDVLISTNVIFNNEQNIRVDYSDGTRVLDNEAYGAYFDGLAIFRSHLVLADGNDFHDNGFSGIYVESVGNEFSNNVLEDNEEFDANDTTTGGSGTGGTGNLWQGNTIGTMSPSGLK